MFTGEKGKVFKTELWQIGIPSVSSFSRKNNGAIHSEETDLRRFLSFFIAPQLVKVNISGEIAQ
jgi:hypothetical protein